MPVMDELEKLREEINVVDEQIQVTLARSFLKPGRAVGHQHGKGMPFQVEVF